MRERKRERERERERGIWLDKRWGKFFFLNDYKASSIHTTLCVSIIIIIIIIIIITTIIICEIERNLN